MKRMEFLRARRSAVITLAIILLTCVIIATLVDIVNRPVNARIITPPPSPSTQAAVPPPQLVSVSGTYAKFSYPTSFHPVTNTQELAGNELAAYVYTKADVQAWLLAIDITQLSTPNLESDGSYIIRKDNPAEYQESTVTYGGNTFVIMDDTDAVGFGEVAFILHGTMDATIALTGNDTLGISSLDTVFQQVLQSWHWN